jgi:hypothetical protein
VRPGTERDVLSVGAADHELIRVSESRWIPVGRTDRNPQSATGRYFYTGDDCVRDCASGHAVYPGLVAQKLLNETGDERRIRSKLREELRLPEKSKE